MIHLSKSRLRLFLILFIGLAVLIVSYFKMFENKVSELVIYDQDTKEEYARTTLNPNDTFDVEWIHSVEQTKWVEKLAISDAGTIALIETRFKSFGSGVPNEKEGKVVIQDGYVVMSDFYEEKEYYQWIHSHNAEFKIKKNNQAFLETNDIPHHHKAEIIIE